MSKRSLVKEIAESIGEFREHESGKKTLRTHKVDLKPLPQLDPEMIKTIRESRHYSRPLFAQMLRISSRTLENWEQGRAEPNVQAKILLLLFNKNPSVIAQIAQL